MVLLDLDLSPLESGHDRLELDQGRLDLCDLLFGELGSGHLVLDESQILSFFLLILHKARVLF